MDLNLPNDINAFVKSVVSDGRFETEQAAIIEGVRLLMGREQLKSEVQIGLKQLDEGKYVDEETLFAEIESEIESSESANE